MPDFRAKKRASQMLRKPSRMSTARIGAQAMENHRLLVEQIMHLRSMMLTPSQARGISRQVYGDEMARFEKLRDDAVVAINELCVLNPRYRKKLNEAIKKSLQ